VQLSLTLIVMSEPQIIKLENLFPHQLEEIVRNKPAIIFPVGSIEWHGPHNSIAVDTLKIQSLCLEIAQKTGTVIAPSLFYGQAETLKDHPGTLFGISELTYYTYLKEIFEGFYHLGFRLVFCFSGHYEGGQFTNLQKAAKFVERLHSDMRLFTFTEPYFTNLYPKAVSKKELMKDAKYYNGDHAGVYETSLMMHYHPDLVDKERLVENLEILPKMVVDPINSSPEFGKHLAEIIITEASDYIQDQLAAWMKANQGMMPVDQSASTSAPDAHISSANSVVADNTHETLLPKIAEPDGVGAKPGDSPSHKVKDTLTKSFGKIKDQVSTWTKDAKEVFKKDDHKESKESSKPPNVDEGTQINSVQSVAAKSKVSHSSPTKVPEPKAEPKPKTTIPVRVIDQETQDALKQELMMRADDVDGYRIYELPEDVVKKKAVITIPKKIIPAKQADDGVIEEDIFEKEE
jgi:creatinine amidohydrolase